MIHLPQLITDLGLILIAAAIITLLFKKIQQPLVLGYILAGLLVGPHFSFSPTVSDEKSITIWAEIGVIFLLFNLGLEFSFKKLVQVGPGASITAVVEIICMLSVGFVTGYALGWSTMDSIFLGGILSISSTTIIIRAFDELGVQHKEFARLVFGALIVEDLVAILLLVLLSTLAVSREFAGTEMVISVLKLGFFLTLWFLRGIFIVPTLLRKLQKLMNDETMLIVSLALCLLMVTLAVQVGFSPALGAFIMGSILAETTQAERIEHLTKSVKDLFAAIFCVSVGMLINPQILLDCALPIVVITLVMIVGKMSSCCLGALLSGQSLKTSVQTGMSLSQIGEFSFIIATLGVTLKVTSPFLYPIAVAVSAISTFTTPYLIKHSDRAYEVLVKRLPADWFKGMHQDPSSTQRVSTANDWGVLLRANTINIGVHSAIILAIVFLTSRFIQPLVSNGFKNGFLGATLLITLSILLSLPFLWALAFRKIKKSLYSTLWLQNKYTRGPLIALQVFRLILAVFYVTLLFKTFLPIGIAIGLAVLTIGLVTLIFSRNLQGFYGGIEKHFLSNLHERERLNQKQQISPWNTYVAELMVAPESELVGKTLGELRIREQLGVSIVLIERGKLTIATPGSQEALYPNDKVRVLGSDEQISHLKELLEVSDQYNETTLAPKIDVELRKVFITDYSPLSNQSIRESGIRERTQSLVVGIEREGERIVNPSADLVFQPGGIMWIVGNSKRLKELLT